MTNLGSLSFLTSKKFWIPTTLVACSCLTYYDWYRDTYATPQQRYDRIKNDYILEIKLLQKLRKEFIKEMEIALLEPDNIPPNKRKSSMKCLKSHITKIPTGKEKGLYYALDWGGSNFRILRLEFDGKGNIVDNDDKPRELKTKILEKYQKTQDRDELFDFLAKTIKSHMEMHGDLKRDDQLPMGFTFSFPTYNPTLNTGILISWTKGFDVPNCEGENITELMHKSFKKFGVPSKIDAVVNDTVGTLLAGSFDYKNVLVGLILGTGSNACYIEPKDGEIKNIEWGGFNSINLPRMPIDFIMDEYTSNRGKQFCEKMISGYYMGEMVRLLSLEVFRNKITDLKDSTNLNKKWGFDSMYVSQLLKLPNVEEMQNLMSKNFNIEFNTNEIIIFENLCKLIVNRSADIAVTCLTAVLEKSGMFKTYREDDRNPFENDRFVLCGKYKSEYVTVGVDGSVFEKTPGYKDRMKQTIIRICGSEIASRIRLVHSADGSGKGAALAVAANR